MQTAQYLDFITEKLQNNFNIYTDYVLKDYMVNIYAYCNIDNQKYLGSKKMKIWNYEINEHCLINVINESLTEDYLLRFTNWLENLIPDLAKPHPDHMQTYLTGVIVTTEELNKDIKNQIAKYKYNKSFKWGLQGWCDLRLLAVDLANLQVITNKKAKEVKQVYQPIIN